MAALAACKGRPVAGEAVAAPRSDPASRPTGMTEPDPFAFDPELFEKKHKPKRGDWLASFPEPGQTFAQYVAQAPRGLTAKRTVIVLQPIGPFSRDEVEVLGRLAEFTSAYFQLRVRVEKAVPLPDDGKRKRTMGPLAWTQYHTGKLMSDLLWPKLPQDAVCYLGVTMADLYPDPSWNFVFGEASFYRRVGVYSLARYTNRFWGRAETEASKALFLRRSWKVLAHETGHMFSIAHCTKSECLMNGSNSLDEMDRAPIHLCPDCLHKLQWNLKLDVGRHYREQGAIYARAGYGDLADWIRRRLARLEPAASDPGPAPGAGPVVAK